MILLVSRNGRRIKAIKAKVPVWLARRSHRYVAERYRLRKRAISRATINLIKKELGIIKSREPDTVDAIVGLELLSNHLWEGEDLVEALRKKSLNVSH